MEIYKNTYESTLADIADADADDPARGVADADADAVVPRASATDDEAIASSSARLPLGATRDRTGGRLTLASVASTPFIPSASSGLERGNLIPEVG